MHLFCYSVNPWLPYYVAKQYRGDKHRVWCSEHFDGRSASSISLHASIAASSNPAQIYTGWQDDVQSRDKHSQQIARVSQVLVGLGETWYAAGELSRHQRDDIVYLATQRDDYRVWRPLIYIIDRASVGSRLTLVPGVERASAAWEYRIEDLHGSEFEVIEVE